MKKLSKKRIILFGVGILVVVLALGGWLLFTILGNAAKLTEYELGAEKIRSINSVIGEERKVTGVNVGTQNGTQYKRYTYKTSSMVEDLIAYSTYLQENGWVVTQDYDLYDGNGEMKLGIESEDYGKILVMSIKFKETQYVIRISKLIGVLPLD